MRVAWLSVDEDDKNATWFLRSKMLNVKTSSTVNGIASITVGSIDTRATNQDRSKNSRHAKGLRGMSTNVSNAMA